MRDALRQSSVGGFTLIETLVVILIAGILAAIAAPSWQGIAASRRADIAQTEILQTLRQAQADAVRTRQSQTVTFNTTATPPTVQVNNRSAIQLGEATVQSQLPSRTLGLQVSGSSDNVVEFDSRGMVEQGVNMIITVTSPANNGKRRCVIVETILGALRTAQNDECRPT